MTALIDAIKKGNYAEAVKLVSKSNSYVAETDSEGRTPLWWAVKLHVEDLVIELLVYGANIHAKSKTGESPFSLAYRSYQSSNGKTYKNIIHCLLYRWDHDIRNNLYPIDFKDNMGHTLLYWATYLQDKDKIIWLLDNGANSLLVGDDAISPLKFANRPGVSKILDFIYDLMLQKTFPWLFEPSIYLQARAILYGWRWRLPNDSDILKISYTFEKYNYTQNDPLFGYITSLEPKLAYGQRLDAKQRKAVQRALKYYSSIFSVEFYETEITEYAQLSIRQANLHEGDVNTGAHTDTIVDADGYITQACVSLDSKWLRDPLSPVRMVTVSKNGRQIRKSFYYEVHHTILHELGHVFGLKHPRHTYTVIETIMSYNMSSLVDNVFPETIMPNDWLAMLTMIKPNMNYHIDNNVYIINGEERHLVLIIDQGGIDEIDASRFNGDAALCLRQGVINVVGHYRFIIAPYIDIENLKASKGKNKIEDNDLNNFIDLNSSMGESEVLLTKGDDTLILGSGKTTIIIDSKKASGTKTIIGFVIERDELLIQNARLVKEVRTESTGNSSVLLQCDTAKILFEGFSMKDLPQPFLNSLISKNQILKCEGGVCDFSQQKSIEEEVEQDAEVSEFEDDYLLRKNIANQDNKLMIGDDYFINYPVHPISFVSSSDVQSLKLPESPSASYTPSILLSIASGAMPAILGVIALYILYRAFAPIVSYAKTNAVSFFASKSAKLIERGYNNQGKDDAHTKHTIFSR